ncbi:MAG TPA: phenylacetic acid degradation protein PaaN [Candidatus Limnocylindrales bacterium]
MFEQHRPTLERAIEATRERTYWSPYPEIPSGSIYGETANADGRAAFEALLGQRFPIDQPATIDWAGEERSPFGFDLGVTYPVSDPSGLVAAAVAALPAWRDAGADARADVLLEILDRINRRSFEMGFATMHTTGQPFVMAFQAGGPHAQDRALEAVAYAYAEMTRHATTAHWEKPQGKREPLRLEKTFRVVPRGVALLVGCNTFPNWNGYPGLFASLATGNPTIIKPHRRAVLPLALTVAIAREVLAEAGFDPNVVTLAAERPGERLASTLATRPEVKLVDFTGSSAYGTWLEDNVRQAQVYAEKSGVNSIVIDSTDDLDAMADNVAFSLALYSGQMCTAPQNLLVPRDGITVRGERVTLDEVGAAVAAAIERLTADPARAVEVLGAIVSDDVVARLEAAPSLGRTILASRSIEHPQFAEARVRTPVLLGVDAADEAAYGEERFGPISFLVATDSTERSLEVMQRTATSRGAITAAVYSTSEDVLRRADDVAAEAGVNIAANLTGGIWINQSAAFSDFHATGANPAANACLTDAAFVAGRFRVVESRRPSPPSPVAATPAA